MLKAKTTLTPKTIKMNAQEASIMITSKSRTTIRKLTSETITRTVGSTPREIVGSTPRIVGITTVDITGTILAVELVGIMLIVSSKI